MENLACQEFLFWLSGRKSAFFSTARFAFGWCFLWLGHWLVKSSSCSRMKMRLKTEINQNHRQYSDCEDSDANIKIIFLKSQIILHKIGVFSWDLLRWTDTCSCRETSIRKSIWIDLKAFFSDFPSVLNLMKGSKSMLSQSDSPLQLYCLPVRPWCKK